MKPTLKLKNIVGIKFDGIDHRDAPDYCDAFITEAWILEHDGFFAAIAYGLFAALLPYPFRKLTDAELDWLNDQSDFVYEKLMDEIH